MKAKAAKPGTVTLVRAKRLNVALSVPIAAVTRCRPFLVQSLRLRVHPGKAPGRMSRRDKP